MAAAFGGISVCPPSVAAVVAIILAGILLLVSVFVSTSETAFLSLSPADLHTVAGRKHPSDEKITLLLDDAGRLWATVRMADCVVSVAVAVLTGFFCMTVFRAGVPGVALLLLFVFLSLLLLLPKVFTVRNPLAFCRFAAPGLMLLRAVSRPFSSLLPLPAAPQQDRLSSVWKNHHMLVDELSHALDLTDKAETSEEGNLLEGVIRFGGETVKEVMTSRPDVVDLEIHTPFREVLKCVVENAYSRIPVYAETRDNIRGVLYVKDLLPHVDKGDDFRWQSLVRPAYFVPETKMIGDLLRDFQAEKKHIAIVVDEFGGTSGIVTMEDIIEEIVGEIRDEYDDEEHTYAVLDDHTWVFEAKTQLPDFYKITKIGSDVFEEVAGDADTLAGLVLELKGEFPALHEKVAFGCYEFEVLAMDNRRILKVKFTIHDEAAADAGEGA